MPRLISSRRIRAYTWTKAAYILNPPLFRRPAEPLIPFTTSHHRPTRLKLRQASPNSDNSSLRDSDTRKDGDAIHTCQPRPGSSLFTLITYALLFPSSSLFPFCHSFTPEKISSTNDYDYGAPQCYGLARAHGQTKRAGLAVLRLHRLFAMLASCRCLVLASFGLYSR